MKTKIKREKSTSTKGHYITNAVLLPEVIRAKSLGRVTDELAKMIMMIAERYSRKSNFVGYSFREDMVAAALINLCNNALNFDPEKSSNPFSFYTTAIHNSFLQYMANEKKHRNIRDSLRIDAGSNPSFNFSVQENDGNFSDMYSSDEIQFRREREIDPDDLPYDENEDGNIDGLVSMAEDSSSGKSKKTKKMTIRQQLRAPGPVTVYKAKDVEVDENGNIVIKEKVKGSKTQRPAKSTKKETLAKKPTEERKKTLTRAKKEPNTVESDSLEKKSAVKKKGSTIKKSSSSKSNKQKQ